MTEPLLDHCVRAMALGGMESVLRFIAEEILEHHHRSSAREVAEMLLRAGGDRAALAALPPDGPAVPSGREPAAVAGEPSDEELLQLMPEQFRADLGTVSRMAAHGAGPNG